MSAAVQCLTEQPQILCVESVRALFLLCTLCHTDSTCRTHKATEMTAHTLGADESRLADLMESRCFIAYLHFLEDDGLMTAVITRYLTTTAAYAQLLVELGVDDGVAIQIVGLQE